MLPRPIARRLLRLALRVRLGNQTLSNIRLPMPGTMLPTECEPPAAIKSSKILIVDDIAVNVKVARAHLETAGYTNFVTLTDATEAIATVKNIQPDVVLLDIMMPDVSG